MKTYQDYLKAKEAGNVLDFIKSAINEYKESQENFEEQCEFALPNNTFSYSKLNNVLSSQKYTTGLMENNQ